MNGIEIIKKRRSVREYRDKPVPKNILEKIVDSARFAATARNIQPWEFIVVTDPAMLKKIAGLADNGSFIGQAAACIAVFCSDTKYYLEDGCAATENLLLAACGYGVGSCWVAGDKKPYCQEVSGLLKVPVEFKLVSLVSLGYPAKEDAFMAVDKRSLREVIHWEKF